MKGAIYLEDEITSPRQETALLALTRIINMLKASLAPPFPTLRLNTKQITKTPSLLSV
jgi:hypothetical protein